MLMKMVSWFRFLKPELFLTIFHKASVPCFFKTSKRFFVMMMMMEKLSKGILFRRIRDVKIFPILRLKGFKINLWKFKDSSIIAGAQGFQRSDTNYSNAQWVTIFSFFKKCSFRAKWMQCFFSWSSRPEGKNFFQKNESLA